MNRLVNTLFSAVGAAALVVAFAPTDAAAQRSARHQEYRAPARAHQHRATPSRRHQQVRRAPVRRVYTSPRVITHPHYGGPIYYRNSSLYVRPTTRYVYPSTRYYAAPRTTYSYGYSTRRSYCR